MIRAFAGSGADAEYLHPAAEADAAPREKSEGLCAGDRPLQQTDDVPPENAAGDVHTLRESLAESVGTVLPHPNLLGRHEAQLVEAPEQRLRHFGHVTALRKVNGR